MRYIPGPSAFEPFAQTIYRLCHQAPLEGGGGGARRPMNVARWAGTRGMRVGRGTAGGMSGVSGVSAGLGAESAKGGVCGCDARVSRGQTGHVTSLSRAIPGHVRVCGCGVSRHGGGTHSLTLAHGNGPGLSGASACGRCVRTVRCPGARFAYIRTHRGAPSYRRVGAVAWDLRSGPCPAGPVASVKAAGVMDRQLTDVGVYIMQ